MDAVRVVLNYKDYEALPADGRRYEIHEGDLSVTPAPGTRHQRTVGRLFVAIYEHVDERRLGEVFVAPYDVILSDTSIVQPDIVYVATDRLAAISARGIDGAPTLVVEVLSPSTVDIDRHLKLQLYARYRIPHYWIVDPDARVIETYALTEGGYRSGVRAVGDGSLCIEPFPDLVLTTALLWP